MTLEQIGQLNLENSFFEILNRLVDFSVISDKLPAYTIDPDTTLSMYDRVSLHTSVSKPLLTDMEAEFLVYKQKLTDMETARLAEMARREALQLRIDALGNNFHSLLAKANIPNIPNSAIEYKRIIDEDDTVRLDALELAQKTLKQDQTLQSRKDKLNELRKLRDIKLKEVDVMINELSLGIRTDKQAIIDYRQALKDVPNQYIKVNNDPKVSVDSIDLANYVWPTKPV